MLRDWKKVLGIVAASGSDFWVAALYDQTAEALPQYLSTMQVAKLYVADVFTHCFVANSDDIQGDSDLVFNEFGLGLRHRKPKKWEWTANNRGCVFILVNRDGKTAILREREHGTSPVTESANPREREHGTSPATATESANPRDPGRNPDSVKSSTAEAPSVLKASRDPGRTPDAVKSSTAEALSAPKVPRFDPSLVIKVVSVAEITKAAGQYRGSFFLSCQPGVSPERVRIKKPEDKVFTHCLIAVSPRCVHDARDVILAHGLGSRRKKIKWETMENGQGSLMILLPGPLSGDQSSQLDLDKCGKKEGKVDIKTVPQCRTPRDPVPTDADGNATAKRKHSQLLSPPGYDPPAKRSVVEIPSEDPCRSRRPSAAPTPTSNPTSKPFVVPVCASPVCESPEDAHYRHVREIETQLELFLPFMPKERICTDFVQTTLEEAMRKPAGFFNPFRMDIGRIWRTFLESQKT